MASKVHDINAAFIRDFLKKDGIPVVAERLLGERPLEVRFRTDTGQAFVKPSQRRPPRFCKKSR